jgi:hypothetical protein
MVKAATSRSSAHSQQRLDPCHEAIRTNRHPTYCLKLLLMLLLGGVHVATGTVL